MKLKGLSCVRSKINGSVYHGEVEIDGRHILFIIKGTVEDDIKILQITKLIDVNTGESIVDANIDSLILRGF